MIEDMVLTTDVCADTGVRLCDYGRRLERCSVLDEAQGMLVGGLWWTVP